MGSVTNIHSCKDKTSVFSHTEQDHCICLWLFCHVESPTRGGKTSLGAQYATYIFQAMSAHLDWPRIWWSSESWLHVFLLHLHKMLSSRAVVHIAINRVKYCVFCTSTWFSHTFKILLNSCCLAHMATFPCQKDFCLYSGFMSNFYLYIKSKYLLLHFIAT